MRLDKFLKVSRLIKRRTVANEACDAGRVLVNGKTAKASVKVKPGDVIEIQFGTRTVKVEVLEGDNKKRRSKGLIQIPVKSVRQQESISRSMVIVFSNLRKARNILQSEIFPAFLYIVR